MEENKENELVICEIPRYARRYLKILASHHSMTMFQYLEKIINQAYLDHERKSK